jgi:hypothetical protein
MSDSSPEADHTADPLDVLREQTRRLEQELADVRKEADEQLTLAGLRTEAVRAGMIDLDGLKMLDRSSVKLGDDRQITNGAALMQDLRRKKPWLFGPMSSSSIADAPHSQPPRPKLATEMSHDEYIAARAAILRHRV